MLQEIISELPLIVAGTGLETRLREFIAADEGHFPVVISDSNTCSIAKHFIGLVGLNDEAILHITLPAGESSKSLDHATIIWKNLLQSGLGRNTLLIAIGGGMVCDLTGFVASVFMRGVPFCLVPTSLLAMADASVGGKTGINFGGVKNILGTFNEASAVFIDFNCLSGLPADERLSGIAEIIKHQLLLGNKLKNTVNNCMGDHVASYILQTVKHKWEITRLDFRENNIRETLNLGHTTAHALEALYFEKNLELLHGFAVAAGLLVESFLAEAWFSGDIDLIYHQELRQEILENFPPVHFEEAEIPQIINWMYNDKKNRSSSPAFSLLRAPASCKTQCRPSEVLIRTALSNYLQHARIN
jgi:3-dehydroquinate synthase